MLKWPDDTEHDYEKKHDNDLQKKNNFKSLGFS